MKKRFALLVSLSICIAIISVSCSSPKTDSETEIMGKVAVMVAEGFHDAEAYMPMAYLVNKGYEVTVIGPAKGIVNAYNTDFTILIEKSLDEVTPADFDALILPGGKGPAVLREDVRAINFVKEFAASGKVTAAICHGPQILVTADVINGHTATGLAKMREEIQEAGANFVDEPLVVDKNIITSRVPKDLYVFSKAIDETIKKLK